MYALRAKRSELAGLAKVAERDLAKLYADLEAIDGALRVFDPTIQLAVIRPKVIRAKPDARFGRFTSLMMVVLREAAEPLTARQIADKIIEDNKIPVPSSTERNRFINKVRTALRRQRSGVQNRESDGAILWWAE